MGTQLQVPQMAVTRCPRIHPVVSISWVLVPLAEACPVVTARPPPRLTDLPCDRRSRRVKSLFCATMTACGVPACCSSPSWRAACKQTSASRAPSPPSMPTTTGAVWQAPLPQMQLATVGATSPSAMVAPAGCTGSAATHRSGISMCQLQQYHR